MSSYFQGRFLRESRLQWFSTIFDDNKTLDRTCFGGLDLVIKSCSKSIITVQVFGLSDLFDRSFLVGYPTHIVKYQTVTNCKIAVKVLGWPLATLKGALIEKYQVEGFELLCTPLN